MLPRHILCVLTLVLCYSYVLSAAAASHESTGKFKNLIHGRNSSLSPQPLAALSGVEQMLLRGEANRVLNQLEDVMNKAKAEKAQGEAWENSVRPMLRAAYSAQDTINGLNIPEKEELLRIVRDAISKAQEADRAAASVRHSAEYVLENTPQYVERIRRVKEFINTAQEENETEIRKEFKAGTDRVTYNLNYMRESRERAIEAIAAANETVPKVQEAIRNATQKQEEKTVSDTSSAPVTEPETQPETPGEESTAVSQSPNINESSSESDVIVEKEQPEPAEEEEVTEDAEESSSVPVNPPNSTSVDTNSHPQVPGNTAKPNKEETTVNSNDQNVSTEVSKESYDEKLKETTDQTYEAADISKNNNPSTPSVRNDMDGTNTLGWVHLPLIAVTALAYVAVY